MVFSVSLFIKFVKREKKCNEHNCYLVEKENDNM
jgi:hypothetical protein